MPVLYITSSTWHPQVSLAKHEDGQRGQAEFDAPMKHSLNTKAEYPTMVGATSTNPRTKDEFSTVGGEIKYGSLDGHTRFK